MPPLWEELQGSPIEQHTLLGGTATMTVICDWSKRHQIANMFLGRLSWYPHYILQSGGSTVAQNKLAIVCTGVNIRGFGVVQSAPLGGGLIGKYEKAELTLEFGVPNLGVPILTTVSDERGRGDLISETFESSSEFLTLDHEKYKWKSDGEDLSPAEAPGMLLGSYEYVFTRYNIPTVPLAAFDLENHVNINPLRLISPMVRHLTFAPETVLYRGFSAQQSMNPDTLQPRITVSYRFALRKKGWNVAYRGDVQRWDRLVRKSDDVDHDLFEKGDLILL